MKPESPERQGSLIGRLRPQPGLRATFTFWVSLALIITLGTAAVYGAWAQQRLLKRGLAEKASALGHFLAIISPEAIYGYDFITLERFTKEVATDPDILYAVILDNNGLPLTNGLPLPTAPAGQSRSLRHPLEELKASQDIIQLHFPITDSGEALGEVVIGADPNRLRVLATRNSYELVAIYLLGLLLLAALIFVVFRHNVIRPVRALSEGAKRMAAGDFQQPVEVFSGDELGELTAVFNQMMREIREDRQQLLDTNQQLLRLSWAVEQSPVSVVVTDLDGRIEYVNPRFTAVTGYAKEEVLGQNPRILKSGETKTDDYRELWETISAGGVWKGELHNRRKNGELYWEEALMQGVTDQYGKVVSYLAVKEDITERKLAEKALRESEERQRLILESSNEGIFGIDTTGCVTFANQAAAEMLGYQRSELEGAQIHNLTRHSRADGSPIPEGACPITKTARDGGSHHSDHEVFWRKDRTSFPVEYSSKSIIRDDRVIGAVVAFHDISERRLAEEKIEQLAFHDALTGLPNRVLFNERLHQSIAKLDRYGTKFALMFLDLDHFKDINDSLGHPTGDALLTQVAQRFCTALREVDTIARMGGDEFAVLLEDVEGPSAAALLAERLVDLLQQPFLIDDSNLEISTSIGIVIVDSTRPPIANLLAQADLALYGAKEAGRNQYLFFEDKMTQAMQLEAELAARLPTAMENGELYLVFQPQIDLVSNELKGLEALLRWNHPERGEISPQTAIAIIQKRGKMDSIGHWVTTEVCRQIQRWKARGVEFVRVAINISGAQIREPEALKSIVHEIRTSGVALHEVELELTETILVEAQDSVRALMEQLADQGLQFSIDDFGTGYSSLSYLRHIKAHKLKIDREFIHDMLDNEHDLEIVKATVALGRTLGMTVLAEGVETLAQASALRALHCDLAQGYLFQKPVTAEDLERHGVLSARTAGSTPST